MRDHVQDLVHAGRALAKARAFTAVCVTSLSLGMGVVIAIMLLSRLLIDTPPGVRERGLAEFVIRPTGSLLAQSGAAMLDGWSYPDYLDVRDATRAMAITGWSRGEAIFQPPHQGPPLSISAMYVSSNYFSTIGTTLALGPGFTRADDAASTAPEAVIGHRVWETRFGRDPGIIGRTITINQVEHTVVGITPPRFRGHITGLDEGFYQLWLPLSRHPRLEGDGSNARGADGRAGVSENARLARDAAWVRILARLPDSMTIPQANAMVQSAMAALASRYPATNQDKTGGVEPYFAPGARRRSQVAVVRLMFFGVSAVVLLVVGLNLSGMMLVRGAMRERELAVKLAMGASRWRLMRHHLSEAFVMAILGGSVASALLFGVPVVIASTFNLLGPEIELFRPDPWIALQCLALCFVTSLVLGLLPALRFSRSSIITALKNDSAGSGQRVGRLQRLTAAAQAGLAVPFLVMCGVQFDQARVTAFADTGFTPKGLYAARLNLSSITRSADDQRLFVRRVQENLAPAPGISHVSAGDGVPLDFIYRDVRVSRDGESSFVQAHTTRVEPGYLETIGTRLLAGRAIDADDRQGAERVVVLSEPLTRQLFPNGDPLGGRVSFALPGGEPQTYTVVGISADLMSTQMGNPRPQLFLSLAQQPATSLLVIARGAPSDASMRSAFEHAIADALRAIGSNADPSGAMRDFFSGEWLIENSRSDLLTSSAVGGGAAGVALVLAALGVYGVIAFMVTTRTREIGVRVALGASRTRVLRDVLLDALRLVVPGIGVGLVLAVLWVRLADPAWYPLGGVEPLVYSLAAATAFIVAAIAGIPSARRAAAVEPLVAIRAE